MTINVDQLEQDVLAVAAALLPLVVPGASPEIVAAVGVAVQATTSLVENVKQDFSDPGKAAADETLAALQARVDAHVAATEAALAGDGGVSPPATT